MSDPQSSAPLESIKNELREMVRVLGIFSACVVMLPELLALAIIALFIWERVK